MNDLLKIIETRRSVRKFREENVLDDVVHELLRVGTLAPNGGNTQGLRFVVVRNRAKIDHYATLGRELSLAGLTKARDGVSDTMKKAGMDNMIKMLSNPALNIFYSAPLVIFIFTASEAITPVEDASLAAENMMLYARSLGIGSCWIGFGKALEHSPEFKAEAGVPPGHMLVAPLVFGYPMMTDMAPVKRDEPKIFKWID